MRLLSAPIRKQSSRSGRDFFKIIVSGIKNGAPTRPLSQNGDLTPETGIFSSANQAKEIDVFMQMQMSAAANSQQIRQLYETQISTLRAGYEQQLSNLRGEVDALYRKLREKNEEIDAVYAKHRNSESGLDNQFRRDLDEWKEKYQKLHLEHELFKVSHDKPTSVWKDVFSAIKDNGIDVPTIITAISALMASNGQQQGNPLLLPQGYQEQMPAQQQEHQVEMPNKDQIIEFLLQHAVAVAAGKHPELGQYANIVHSQLLIAKETGQGLQSQDWIRMAGVLMEQAVSQNFTVDNIVQALTPIFGQISQYREYLDMLDSSAVAKMLLKLAKVDTANPVILEMLIRVLDALKSIEA